MIHLLYLKNLDFKKCLKIMGQMILLLMGHCSASHVAFGRSYVRYSFLRHTLYWWWVYDHYHVHLQLWYSAWLHLSTWGFWHPLTSHDSHPFHITQGISPSFFSHLPVQNSLLSFGKPILFLSAQPSRDSKLVSALPVWELPWATVCELTLTSMVLCLSLDLLSHPSASQAWGCWIL